MERRIEVTNTQRELTTVVPEHAIRFRGHRSHAHREPHLIHVVAGTADLLVDGRAVRLGTRESLWLAPGVPHSARYAPGSVVLGPLLSPGTVPAQRVQRLGVVPQVTRLMTTVLGAAPATPEQIRPFRAALDVLLRSLGSPYFTLRQPVHPAARAVARAAMSDLTLDELAAAQGTSVRHVQRVFREETGMSFSRWRARARLNVAISRLRGGDGLTVAAHLAGYTTRSGLLKALTRETGLPGTHFTGDPASMRTLPGTPPAGVVAGSH
ncbi:helix-turn-helix domain-containing protein [Streptomyces sp. NPDC049879]|uniref:helix-turn-helix domain-containing protein n=1 Tax=Streptomyces sp. NPDC049879 TaxID=3365598 RepID=UPI0037974891